MKKYLCSATAICQLFLTPAYAFIQMHVHPEFKSSVDGRTTHNYTYVYSVRPNAYPSDDARPTCSQRVTALQLIRTKVDGTEVGLTRALPTGYDPTGKNMGEIVRDNPTLGGVQLSTSEVAVGDTSHNKRWRYRFIANGSACGDGTARIFQQLHFPQPPNSCSFDVADMSFNHGALLNTASGGGSTVEKSLRIKCNLHLNVQITTMIFDELPVGQDVYFSLDGVRDSNTYLVQYDRTLAVKSTVQWDGNPGGAGPLNYSGVIVLDIQ